MVNMLIVLQTNTLEQEKKAFGTTDKCFSAGNKHVENAHSNFSPTQLLMMGAENTAQLKAQMRNK